MLVGGESPLALRADVGEMVRFYLTNTANTRVFNVCLAGARMKLVGGDSGRYEREEFAEEVLLAPSERAVVDVLFDRAGSATLEHHTPDRCYPLAAISVDESPVSPSLAAEFETLRSDPDLVAQRSRLAARFAAAPDKTLAFVAEMALGTPEGAVVFACPMHAEVVSADEGACPRGGMKLLATAVSAVYTCPMHAEVASAEPASCPKCGMKLLAAAISYACPMHPDVTSGSAGRCPECGMKLLPSQFVSGAAARPGTSHEPDGHDHADSGGIEWEDDMVEVNKITTPANMRWKLVDRSDAAENHAIDWRFRVGDEVKIRLVNEMDSDHPMHHPFHIHGAGRFLVLGRDGVEEPNLVWKDTVLVRTGETVDILLDITNPGVWMAHCHIAEHHESGMMFSFHVDP